MKSDSSTPGPGIARPDVPEPRIPNPESRQLSRLRRVWEALGRDDPLWAVLSDPDKRGRRWDSDEFFETGRLEVETQMAEIDVVGYPVGRTLALDFGCGAGRLTRALARHFERAIGIDVSASMVDTARRLNAGIDGLEFRVNPSPRIDGIAGASVDFVFSRITLQHIPADLAEGYVDEFFRILAPGGAAVFQFVDDADDSLRGRLFGAASNRWLNPLRRIRWRRREVFEMHALAESRLRALLARRPELRLLNAIDDSSAGPGWRGRRWFVVNDAPLPVRVDAGDHVIHVDASDVQIGAAVRTQRGHEPQIVTVLRERLARGDVVLDVGANVGVFSLLAASLVGPEGQVHAFEPLRRNAVLLERSAQESGLRNVAVVNAAAGDRAGTLRLLTHPSTSNSATPAAAGERLTSAGSTLVDVPMVRLDDALSSLDRLDLVKIDVAGMEPAVVRGAERLLQRFRPALVCEFHPWAIERVGASPADHLALLAGLYGRIEVLHRDGTREPGADADAVMAVWRRENERFGLGGRLHLDLLFTP